jgi:hypothetical protein
MPLTVFWRRYCSPLMTPHHDLPGIWRFQLMRANRIKEQEIDVVDNEDLAALIDGPHVAHPAS